MILYRGVNKDSNRGSTITSEDQHSADEIFGIVRDVPLNYVDRDEVDQRFFNNLALDKHIVIHGSSKQGKTCLRKHCLLDTDYIAVQSSNRWNLADLHSNILKQAGFEVTQSETKSISGRNKILATLGARIMGIGAQAGAEVESDKTTEATTSPLELDPADVNDVISALRTIGFSKYIIVEDFHYLHIDTQKDFAVALKAFHEASNLTFIIVGVWLEENRLVVYNGDLTGRVLSVDADKWEDKELLQVMDEGASLLNVRFTNNFKQALVKDAYDSVHIVQEVCRRACTNENIYRTQGIPREVGHNIDVSAMVREVVDEQSARYTSFVTQFAEGFQETSLEMYKWLLHPILTTSPEKLESGLRYTEIRQTLQNIHPSGQDLNPGNITQALQSTASLQVSKDMKPIILDYDQTTRRLNVVDRGFLIWLAQQDQDELLDIAGLPTSL